MEFETVDVFIEEDGEVRVEVRKIKGLSCRDVTAPLEQALGGEVQSRELTSEAYEESPTDREQRIART